MLENIVKVVSEIKKASIVEERGKIGIIFHWDRFGLCDKPIPDKFFDN